MEKRPVFQQSFSQSPDDWEILIHMYTCIYIYIYICIYIYISIHICIHIISNRYLFFCFGDPKLQDSDIDSTLAFPSELTLVPS